MQKNTQPVLTLEHLRELREQILEIAVRNHASDVRIFGSVARGNATSKSDIDFLVRFDEGATIYDMAGLKDDLTQLLGIDVDVADDQTKDNQFLKHIEKDLIAL